MQLSELPGGQLLANVVIASGASLSTAAWLNGRSLCGIQMPAAWTAAPLTVQVSFDGGVTFQNLYDTSGNEVSITTAASRNIRIPPGDFAAVTHIKVRSGPSGVPVNQAGDRTIGLAIML